MAYPVNSTSKLGVQVPDQIQSDNRSLVQYIHDGSVRNKLGETTTEHIELGIAMYFWRNPEELREAAQSEYVDESEAFIQRIKHYQDKHLDDLLVAADRAASERPLNYSEDDEFASESVFGGELSQAPNSPQSRDFNPEEHVRPSGNKRDQVFELVRERMQEMQKEMNSMEAEIEELRDQFDATSADS